MLDSIIFCSTLAPRDSLHSLLCRCTLFLSCTPTFVNWALPANKPRVMCRVFIKNMLEKHTPIKDSVFYAERGAERWVWEEEPSEAAALLRGRRRARCCGLQVWVRTVPLLLRGVPAPGRAGRERGRCAGVKHSVQHRRQGMFAGIDPLPP